MMCCCMFSHYELHALFDSPSFISLQMGPLQIDLMVGEYHVLRSIVEYSLPRLIGWSPGLDALIDQSVEKSTAGNNNPNFGGRSPHNYQGNDNGGVPF